MSESRKSAYAFALGLIIVMAAIGGIIALGNDGSVETGLMTLRAAAFAFVLWLVSYVCDRASAFKASLPPQRPPRR